jgi:hypothetical protein
MKHFKGIFKIMDDLDLKSIKKCRDITKEILNFGVTQQEIKKIINLLCLELENTDLMKDIIDLLNSEKELKEEIKNKIII